MTKHELEKRLKKALRDRQHEPGMVIRHELLEELVEVLGGKALSMLDPSEPYQWTDDLYLGVTSPNATTEVPHWHPNQTEYYIILSGEAGMKAKHCWDDDGWLEQVAQAGDVIAIRREVCHLFGWRSPDGLALVVKAPQVPGVGRPPNGKWTCQHCPYFQNGCVLPEGWHPKLPG